MTTFAPAPLAAPVTLTPRESATRGLELLAARLEPIIASTLAPHLQGLPWTVLLQEIDRLKGKIPHTYTATDVQAQLRILTERLGSIGYPFDDHTRAVSTVAGELRIVRNRLFHMDDLTLLDAWRALDFVVRLLARLDDAEGSAGAEAMRDGILRLTVPATATEPHDESDDDESEAGDDEQQVDPDPDVFRRDDEEDAQPKTTLPNERLQFEPWKIVTAGDVSVLDNLKRKENAELVRSVIEEIVDDEGPIHVKRLARLTCRAFGLGRVETKRINQIKHQVKGTALTELDGWVWPGDLGPSDWTEFRPNSSSANRPFESIAPQEIVNASHFLRGRYPNDSAKMHERRILQTFGRQRLSNTAGPHLARSLSS